MGLSIKHEDAMPHNDDDQSAFPENREHIWINRHKQGSQSI